MLSVEECRVVPGRGGADIGEPLNYSTTIAIPLKQTVCGAEECRSAEECRGVPSSAGKGWGRHWGAFKLLYYHCNTTKIDGLWCRGVPKSEECRGVPSGAGKGWGRHWRAFKLLYYHCNTTKIDGLWCRGVPRSAEEPLNYSTTIAISLK